MAYNAKVSFLRNRGRGDPVSDPVQPSPEFFSLVSTEITGSCAARAAMTLSLIWLNCASRSG
jgi:hypothetical protein